MIWKNTKERYGTVAKTFHWTIAAAIVFMLGLGLYMADLEPGPRMFRLYFVHKSTGALILFVMLARLAWKKMNTRPAPLPGHSRVEKLAASGIHIFLYAAAILMPLSGWIMSSAKGFSVSVFGWFTLPAITGKSEGLAKAAVEVHEITAWLLIAAIALHVAGAIKHHVMDKDDTLRRMLPFGAFVLAVCMTAALSAGPAAQAFTPAPAPLPSWEIDEAESSIAFEATQTGAPFTGRFEKFGGTILFDPQRPGESTADITIDLSSVHTGSADHDSNLTGAGWFDTAAFPQAHFRADVFAKTDTGYEARGTLTIHGVSLPVVLPFTLDIKETADGGAIAAAKGGLSLNRLDYNIGTGEWADTAAVGNGVTVSIDLKAVRKAPPL